MSLAFRHHLDAVDVDVRRQRRDPVARLGDVVARHGLRARAHRPRVRHHDAEAPGRGRRAGVADVGCMQVQRLRLAARLSERLGEGAETLNRLLERCEVSSLC